MAADVIWNPGYMCNRVQVFSCVQNMNTRNRRNLVWLLAAFVAAYGVLLLVFHQQTEKFAIEEAEKHIENALLTHRTIHSYVEDVQKPEIYRLKSEGKLYDEYFSPKVLSFTFIARGIKDFLNEERIKAGVPAVYFKLAAPNPRNPINTADAIENALLERMNQGEFEEYKKIHQQEDGPFLYYAMSINANKASCIRCHGSPEDAPKELVERYGEDTGYYEKEGEIRALISIRVPLSQQLQDAHAIFLWLSATTLVVFTIIFLIFWYFFRRMDHLSSTDVLTGLNNRLKFSEEIQRAIDTAKRYAHAMSVIMIDLDHFKKINDTQGHAFGDNVLVRVAHILKQRVRGPDVSARWGGEEFVVACPHTDLEGTRQLAEFLRQAIVVDKLKDGSVLSASFGVAQLQPDDTLETLMERADAALYKSKRDGRNRVTTENELADTGQIHTLRPKGSPV